jgi:glycosyltransferase involved in cell wall biosynthesis
MKKIAFVSDSIYPYNKGGKEKRLFDISTRLSKKGYDVHIYTMKWWKGNDVRKENGITLHAISKLYPLYAGQRRSIKQGLMFGLSCFNLIKEKFDVIDVDHMPFFPLYSTKIVCLIKGKKMFATWHEVWGQEYWNEYLGRLGILSYLIEKFSVLMPDKIISVSDHTSNKLKKELKLKKNIVTIADGIDTGYIRKVKPSSRKSDVIFAGRLLSHKNVDVLIKSIALLKNKNPKIKCLIIGDGPEKKTLGKLVDDLNLAKNISLLGFMENHDTVLSYLKSSKVFVSPSTREGFGIVVIESLACGLPVVVIKHSQNASADLVEQNKNGLLINLGESELSKAISKLIISKRKKEIYFEYAEKYDWENIIPRLEKIYTI